MNKPNIGILGIGSYIPKCTITNEYLENNTDINTTNEWITQRTGIKERHMANCKETVSDIGVKASEKAIKDAGIDKKDIDLIISVSGSPEYKSWPAVAPIIAGKLGINATAYDQQAACAGFVYGIQNAYAQIKSGEYETVLLVGPEIMTRLVKWDKDNRDTCVLFGDSSVALIIGKTEKSGIVGSVLKSEGKLYNILKVDQYIMMDGPEVYNKAISFGKEIIPEILEKYDIEIDSVNFFILHQANQRITDSIGKKLNIPEEKMVSNIERYGNTSSASIPLAIDEIYKERKLKKGDLILTVGFGAGMVYGANLIRWTKDGG